VCCILASLSARPTLGTLRNIMASNKDGVGVAWIDRTFGVVRWKKGLQRAEDVHAITERVPFPFVVHARFATAGGATPGLTHPFPIEAKPSVALEGAAHKVLAHNGHVHDWEVMAKKLGLGWNPRGWSDTRVVAAVVARRGTGILGKTVLGKFAVLSIRGGLQLTGEFHTPAGYNVGSLLASSSTEPLFDQAAWFRAVSAAVERAPQELVEADPFRFWSAKTETQADRMRDEFADRIERDSREERLRRIDAARERLKAKGADRWGKEFDAAAEAFRSGHKGDK